MATLVEQAARVAGDDTVRLGQAVTDTFDGVVPQLVITPRSADAVAATLAWAARERLQVAISGGGTKAEWGRPPVRIDVLLSLSALAAVRDHAHGDLTATIDAGAALDDVNGVLAAHQQWLPVDAVRGARATMGGLLATNDSGPLRHRYGTPRDLVIGATLATSDGVIAHSGGRVVKNVAGYDLARLMAGSHGALAAIVSLTFKLAPRPAATGTGAVKGSPAALHEVVCGLIREQLEPMRVDVRASSDDREIAELLVQFAADDGSVAHGLAALATLAERAGASLEQVSPTHEAHHWSTHAHRAHERRHVVRCGWRTAELPAAIRALETAAWSVPWTFVGRAAVGSGHLGVDADAETAATIVRALRASPALAHVTIVQGSRELRNAVDPWPDAGSAASLWPALKRTWDASNTLGAGRGPL